VSELMSSSLTDTVWNDIRQQKLYRTFGRIVKVVGLTVESLGPRANLGDICSVIAADGKECIAEVVGFRDARLILMPLGELSSVAPGADVMALHRKLAVPCGPGLLGRVLDGLGQPMDGKGPIQGAVLSMLDSSPPNPLTRDPVNRPLQTGVRAIDALMTVGLGQRLGIFAGSGVGKSTLLSMIARNTSADINVIALVGERGREVREFIEHDLGEEGLRRSVVVVSTSDRPALIRLKAAFVATAIAEYFRDCGQRVNLMMDSVTRFAMAQREIGLAVGEPPTSRGYTPSVFALLPKLLERAGAGSNGGSITAFYTVLVDGDDLNDPIADAVRGILDGHVVLSRNLANAGRFPAIDVLASLSRLFPAVTNREHRDAAKLVRNWMQKYKEIEDLLRIGAYQVGSDIETDVAIAKMPYIRKFLEQSSSEPSEMEDTVQHLLQLGGVSA